MILGKSDSLKRAILVGAAPLPRGWLKRELALRSKSDWIIGVDGGVEACLRVGVRPDFAVGDWDSLKKRKSLSGIPHARLSREKDRSDLFFAIEAARYSGVREVIALGISGGRPDHHLAAILDLAQAAAHTGRGKFQNVQARAPEADYYFISPAQKNWRVAIPKGRSVSAFAPLGPAHGVKLKGLAYSGALKRLSPSSHGLSNRVRGASVGVSSTRGVLLLVVPHA